MSANTPIEWADHTFNPWIGCTKVGPGCDNCYAAAWDRRFAQSGDVMHWGAGKARKRTKTWGDPVRWNKQHAAFFAEYGRRQRVFCASLADVFDNEVPREGRYDLLWLISNTPNLDWLLLTKRIGNAAAMMEPACARMGFPWGEKHWPNVWIGATICNQEEADRDIPKLLAVPAAKRFLSMEPLLGAVDLTKVHELKGGGRNPWSCLDGYCIGHFPKRHCGCPNQQPTIDWVIVGGESGPKAQPMHPDWARSLRDQCQAAGVPFLFKQNGEFVSVSEVAGPGAHFTFPDGATVRRVGKHTAGRHLDGCTWDEVPA